MPTEGTQPYKVVCRGGLVTSENFLDLSDNNPGSATVLVNHETSLHGGYRRINGFREFDATFPEVGVGVAEGQVFGVYGFRNDTTGNDEILASRKDTGAATYSIYEHQSGIGWVDYNPGGITFVSTAVVKQRFATFNAGSGNIVTMVDGVNNLTFYDGANWYQADSGSTGADWANAGGPMLVGNDDPEFLTVFKNHIFVASDSTVAYSAPNVPYDWTVASGAGIINVGFTIVQIYPWRNELYVFGENRIKKIVVEVIGSTPTFVLQDVTNNTGCIASDSVLELSGNLIFLSPDGIRPIAGTSNINDVELGILSENIQYLITSLTESADLTGLNSVSIKQKTQFRYFLSVSPTTVATSRGIIGCLRKGPSGMYWEYGELYGIRASATFSGYLTGVEFILHGDYDGFVYQQEKGSDFNEADIEAIYTTPFLDLGDTTIRKSFHKLNTFIRSEGAVEMNIAVRYDWQDNTAVNPSNYVESSGTASIVYDNPLVLYDDVTTVYGGGAQPILRTNIQGSAFSVQFSFVTNGTGLPYTIQGFVVEFAIDGKK